MREIKFRLRIGNQIVGYERWNSLEGKWCYDLRPDGVFDIRNPFISHTDKDRYIGLKDKNGVEIYEGDIVRDKYRHHGRNGEVKWGEFYDMDGEYYPQLYGFYVQYNKSCVEDDTLQYEILGEITGEVIGNIWESPEQLEQLRR